MTKIKPQLLMTFGFLALGLTVAACVPKVTNTNTNQEPNQAAVMEAKDEAIAEADQKVILQMQNNSGQSGTATLTALGDRTKVVLSVAGGVADVGQPAHIHKESCAKIGGVLYPLNLVTNGSSETILDVALDTIMSQQPLSINVHKSAQEASVYVACGDITGNSMMPAEGGSAAGGEDDSVKGDDAMMEDDVTKEDDSMMEETKVFDVAGKNFEFTVKEIRVKKGDKVKINFRSIDGFHDWKVDEFNAKTTQVNTGGSSSVEFVVDQAGTFEYYCGVGRHREMGMVGKLIVE